MSTKYWQYAKERNGESVVETEHGFALYRMVDDETMFVSDIWVSAEHRQADEGTKIMHKLIEAGKSLGAKKMLGSCVPSTPGSTVSMLSMLKRGFKLHAAQNDMIYVIKEI